MFEKATRQKLRFASAAGMLSVEDLWDLPLQSKTRVDLDTIAKAVNKEIKTTEEESFVAPISVENTSLTLKMGILKHIIAVKLEEQDAAKTLREKNDRKKHIMAIMADKQDEELKGKSLDELKKELEAL